MKRLFPAQPLWQKMILCLILLLTLSLLPHCTEAKAKPTGGRAQMAYRYAYAFHDCAPWDGPALRLVLQTEPLPIENNIPRKVGYPHYEVNLWTPSPPLNQWIDLNGNQGNLAFRAAQGDFKTLKGGILFTQMTKAFLEGEVRYSLNNGTGREQSFPFRATLYPNQALCG